MTSLHAVQPENKVRYERVKIEGDARITSIYWAKLHLKEESLDRGIKVLAKIWQNKMMD